MDTYPGVELPRMHEYFFSIIRAFVAKQSYFSVINSRIFEKYLI